MDGHSELEGIGVEDDEAIKIRCGCSDEPDFVTVTRDQFEELKKDFPLECAEIERTFREKGVK